MSNFFDDDHRTKCMSLRRVGYPTPANASEFVTPLGPKEGRSNTPFWVGGCGSGGTQFGRLERKLGTLHTLCGLCLPRGECWLISWSQPSVKEFLRPGVGGGGQRDSNYIEENPGSIPPNLYHCSYLIGNILYKRVGTVSIHYRNTYINTAEKLRHLKKFT